MTFLGLKIQEILIAILAIILFIVAGWGYGKWEYHEGIKYQKSQEKQEVASVKAVSGSVTAQVVTKYVPVIEKIKGDTITIKQKVPVYVTKEDDARAPINVGFVSLWNATNKMQLPSASSTVNEQPSPVVLSDIAAEHATEVGICTATEAQRDALKEWILGQQKAYNGK